MKEYYGNTASGGIALGKIKKLHNECIDINQYEITDAAKEISRIEDAVRTVRQNLKLLYEEALQKAGKETADIFEMHQMILSDKDYLAHIYHCIEEKKENAEAAVQSAGIKFSDAFEQMQDEYMKARAIDVRDISQQLIEVLTNRESSLHLEEPCIIAAEDLTPSQLMKLNEDMVLGVAVKYGSANSHTAILARMLEIPAVMGIDYDLEEMEENTLACVNGDSGAFVIDPDEEMIRKIKDPFHHDIYWKSEK